MLQRAELIAGYLFHKDLLLLTEITLFFDAMPFFKNIKIDCNCWGTTAPTSKLLSNTSSNGALFPAHVFLHRKLPSQSKVLEEQHPKIHDLKPISQGLNLRQMTQLQLFCYT